MYKNGPTGGSPNYLKRFDTVIASSNVVSADAAAAGLFGKIPGTINYLVLAQKKGVGTLEGFTSKKISIQ